MQRVHHAGPWGESKELMMVPAAQLQYGFAMVRAGLRLKWQLQVLYL